MTPWLAAAALLLALAGCATPPPAAPPAPTSALEAEGSVLRHRASGMAFPGEVAGFRRVLPYVYDAAGLDVSASYELAAPRGRMIATMYVFPAPANTGAIVPLDVLFAQYKAEVGAAHGGAKPIAEAAAEPPPGTSGLEGRHARFAYTDLFAGARRPLRSELFVFCCIGARWALEYRFTHGQDSGLDEAVGQFMRALRVTVPADG